MCERCDSIDQKIRRFHAAIPDSVDLRARSRLRLLAADFATLKDLLHVRPETPSRRDNDVCMACRSERIRVATEPLAPGHVVEHLMCLTCDNVVKLVRKARRRRRS